MEIAERCNLAPVTIQGKKTIKEHVFHVICNQYDGESILYKHVLKKCVLRQNVACLQQFKIHENIVALARNVLCSQAPQRPRIQDFFNPDIN